LDVRPPHVLVVDDEDGFRFGAVMALAERDTSWPRRERREALEKILSAGMPAGRSN